MILVVDSVKMCYLQEEDVAVVSKVLFELCVKVYLFGDYCWF